MPIPENCKATPEVYERCPYRPVGKTAVLCESIPGGCLMAEMGGGDLGESEKVIPTNCQANPSVACETCSYRDDGDIIKKVVGQDEEGREVTEYTCIAAPSGCPGGPYDQQVAENMKILATVTNGNLSS